jgi:hypothetical protein
VAELGQMEVKELDSSRAELAWCLRREKEGGGEANTDEQKQRHMQSRMLVRIAQC